jgi:hypothetical protein
MARPQAAPGCVVLLESDVLAAGSWCVLLLR